MKIVRVVDINIERVYVLSFPEDLIGIELSKFVGPSKEKLDKVEQKLKSNLHLKNFRDAYNVKTPLVH